MALVKVLRQDLRWDQPLERNSQPPPRNQAGESPGDGERVRWLQCDAGAHGSCPRVGAQAAARVARADSDRQTEKGPYRQRGLGPRCYVDTLLIAPCQTCSHPKPSEDSTQTVGWQFWTPPRGIIGLESHSNLETKANQGQKRIR